MKTSLMIRENIKYVALLLCGFYIINNATAQTNNIYLDGDNYITIGNEAFPERTAWTDFSESHRLLAQKPTKTYWFVHNGKSHIVVHLKNGKSQFFLELSFNKKLYHFPADINFTESEKEGHYRYNDFTLYLAEKTGTVRYFKLAKNTHLTINVEQIDPSHLKISYHGIIDDYPHPGKWDYGPLSAPMSISGKISLSKKDPSLEHLPDSYAGCDNVVYNEVSPNWKFGDWSSATACEESFYKKIYAALYNAIKPVSSYFKSKGWAVSETKYKPLDLGQKQRLPEFFTFSRFSDSYNFSLTADCLPNSNSAYTSYMNRYMKFIQTAKMIKNGQIDTATAIEANHFHNEGKEFSLRLKIILNSPLQTDGYPNDLNELPVKKISDSIYVIKKVISKDIRMTTYYNAYVLIGKWNAPEWKDKDISATVQFPPNAKRLSVQAFYIELDCGEKLADTIISHLNMSELKKILTITP